jgi:hypothetical protein
MSKDNNTDAQTEFDIDESKVFSACCCSFLGFYWPEAGCKGCFGCATEGDYLCLGIGECLGFWGGVCCCWEFIFCISVFLFFCWRERLPRLRVCLRRRARNGCRPRPRRASFMGYFSTAVGWRVPLASVPGRGTRARRRTHYVSPSMCPMFFYRINDDTPTHFATFLCVPLPSLSHARERSNQCRPLCLHHQHHNLQQTPSASSSWTRRRMTKVTAASYSRARSS